MLLSIPITKIACSKETIEFTILTLDETRVTITTPIIISSTDAFSNGDGFTPGLPTIGRATHHDVDDVTTTNVGIAFITLIGCYYDATVISNNHCRNTIYTATVVAW